MHHKQPHDNEKVDLNLNNLQTHFLNRI